MEGASKQERFTLLGDKPSVDGRDDALGFDEIAESLKDLILASVDSTPFTVGIEGGWGQGKSSLMGRIERKLREAGEAAESEGDPPDGHVTVTTVRFNAWTSGDGDVLEGLVKSVLDTLDESILRRIAYQKRLISWARFGFNLIAHWIGLSSIVDRLWKELDVDPKARNQMHDLLVQTLEEWRDGDPKLRRNHLLVVFIDDLDRCSPQNVIQVFEAMKLYLDARGIAFVVGFDAGVVSSAVVEKKDFGEHIVGDQYLEKVIQIRYQIPATDHEHARRLMESCMDASGTRDVFNTDARKLIIEQNRHNPRRIKRFINSFILDYRLGDWKQIGAPTLIRVLMLKFHYPDFAQLLYAPDDPIEEFLTYSRSRTLLRRATALSNDDCNELAPVFKSYGLDAPTPGDAEAKRAADLHELERRLPEAMPPLADDHKFAKLIEEIRDAVTHGELQGKLARMQSAPDLGELTTQLGNLDGLDVLWITDDERGDTRHIFELRSKIGSMRLVHDLHQARAELAARPPDVLIGDVTRHGDSSAGLNDLATIRNEHLFDGRAMLFTARVTGARRDAAEELGAEITSAWSELLLFLRRVAAEQDAEEQQAA